MSAALLVPVYDSVFHIAVLVIAGIIALLVQKYVKNADARDAIMSALKNAQGLALAHGQAKGDQFLQNATIKNESLKIMATYMADQVPDALKHFGQSEADVANKVTAQLATALSLATPIPTTAPPVTPAADAPSDDATAQVPAPPWTGAARDPAPPAFGIPVIPVGAST